MSAVEQRIETTDWIQHEVALAFRFKFRAEQSELAQAIAKCAVDALESESSDEVCTSLLSALAILQEASQQVIDPCFRFLDHSSSFVRMSAAQALGSALEPSVELSSRLWKMYLEDVEEVKLGAANGLANQITAMPAEFVHELEHQLSLEKEKTLRERLRLLIHRLKKKGAVTP